MTPQKYSKRIAGAQFSLYTRGRSVITGGLAFVAAAALTTMHAFADATPSTDGIGAQFQNMAQEGSTTSGFLGSSAMYACGLITFIGAVWALWQSRQAQNREGGKVAMGAAGLVLCGLFVTGGVWINKAANTASGGAATISSTSSAVTFGN